MSKNQRLGLILLLLSVVALMFRSSLVGAASLSTPDPNDTTGLDIEAAYHSDDATDVTLGFDAFEAFTKSEVVGKWELDLTGTGGFEDCIQLKSVAGTLRAEFFNDCDVQNDGSADATQPATDKVQFKIPLSVLRNDLGMPATATQYKYRLKNTNPQNTTNNVDNAPDQPAPPAAPNASITHVLGAGSATPTPTPTPTSSAAATPTKSPTPSPSSTPTATPTPSGSPGPTATPVATPCPTPVASPTATPTPTASGSPSPTPTASPTATPTGTPSPTPTATATPAATPCPNQTVTGTASPSEAEPGDVVQIAGNGFTASASLTMTFQSTPKPLGTVAANTAGAFATTVTVPADATGGQHHIVVVGASPVGGTRTIRYPITVTGTAADSGDDGTTLAQTSTGAGASSGSGASLPRTGATMAVLLAVSVLLVLGGFTALSEAKMRRRLAGSPRSGR